MITEYAQNLINVVSAEHAAYAGHDEADAVLGDRIAAYWQDLGLAFPGVETAWSAVFISWCVRRAGADATEFSFSPRHAKFIHDAIANAKAGSGVFRGFPIHAVAPAPGDIIQWNRGGGAIDFAFAAQHDSYESHSAIVVATGRDASGAFALTIGGNEGDSIGRTRVPLDAAGVIIRRARNPFIAVIQNLK